MTEPGLTITLVGCGKMGGALLQGWLAADIATRIDVIEPQALSGAMHAPNLHWHSSPDVYVQAGIQSDMFVMAVKPQMMGDVCAALKPGMPANALILSIAAGQTIESFEQRFSAAQPVIRTMPNTPASIGKGMTVAVGNAYVSDLQKRQATAALQSTGLLEWVDDESLLDAVTAVSGSGPAYVFLLIEALAASGEKSGLPADLAMKLARQTVIGAGALAEQDIGTDAATLRKNVTSPGGTTEAALKILMGEDGLEKLMANAVTSATTRSRELKG